MSQKSFLTWLFFVFATLGVSRVSLASAASSKILLSVPFSSQAPLGQWRNDIYQDGCEETSIIMAMAYVDGAVLTPSSTTDLILKITDFEKARPAGYHPDLSASDTLKLIKDYFHYDLGKLETNVTAAQIISELSVGNIVIAPMNGQILPNPYFTPPGPIHHMLVVIGYDPVNNRFITNDPGTRHGAKLTYSVPSFMRALNDYPTGRHLVSKKIRRNIIVIRKTN